MIRIILFGGKIEAMSTESREWVTHVDLEQGPTRLVHCLRPGEWPAQLLCAWLPCPCPSPA